MSLRVAVNEKDHIEGAETAPITLVEYADYECPYCGDAYPVIKELQKKLGTTLKFVFRNFPLSNIHPHALHAALAAEAAKTFGKYKEMHNILFENQHELEDFHLIAYAKKIGIDEQSFEKEFTKSIHIDKINEDIESGLRSGVNGTPSIFINGKKYNDSPYSIEAFLSYINELL